jgi:hypothetical protein
MLLESLSLWTIIARSGRKIKQKSLFLQIEHEASCLKPLTPEGTCRPKPDSESRLARFCMKFGSCFFHRWFNLYDLGLEEDLYILPVLRRFTETDSRHVAAQRGTSVSYPHDYMETDHFPEPEYTPASPARESKSGIPWRSPWLYVSVLVLAWLFVL